MCPPNFTARPWFLSAFLLSAAFAGTLRAEDQPPSASREAAWTQVEEAMQKGLPKTALEALEPILTSALRDEAYGEAARALARKIVLQGEIEGHKPEERIVRLEAELERMPPPMQGILRALLGDWYWEYFQANRWRFLRRTATAEAPGKDIQTWDLPRLFREIDRQFTLALDHADLLKKTPAQIFKPLLEAGTMRPACRPTLYDIVVYEALTFYTSGEQAAAKPEEAFEIAAESPIFSPVEAFLAWQPETSDLHSPLLKAVRLYQDLLTFHREDKDPAAFADADLQRLIFGHNVAWGEDTSSRFKKALEAYAERWADHELSALARWHWARLLRDEGDPVAARRVAEVGARVFPQSVGGCNCRALLAEMEAPSLSLETERIWNAPWPNLKVSYRNVTNLYFRAMPFNWREAVRKQRWYWGDESVESREALLKLAPALEWRVALTPTADYKERVQTLSVPDTLTPGFYFIVASHTPDFRQDNNALAYTGVWVSDLALVTRSEGTTLVGFVLQARSGEPIAEARVEAEFWKWSRNGNLEPTAAQATTDAQGRFRIRPDGSGYIAVTLLALHGNHKIGAWQQWHEWRRPPERRREQTVLFTDRALYRPGQTIQYKGICIETDHGADTYRVLPGQRVVLALCDPNGKEVARQAHRCNDWGSFSGSFTAPRDRLLGAMSLRILEGPRGSASVRVEEYKRPKFYVRLTPPDEAVRLNDRVTVKGEATAYTGAAIDSARVQYRVVRRVRWPWWWGLWGRPAISVADQEIAHGTTTTGADGRFVVRFPARPDRSVSPADEPTFAFCVTAEVTDSAGETRTAEQTILVGYTALQATLETPSWLTADRDVEVAVRTSTLDGQPQNAEGSLRLHRLVEPDSVIRAHLGYEAGEDLSQPNCWKPGEAVFEQGLETGPTGLRRVSTRLGVGAYVAIFETQDRFGKPVQARLPFLVVDPSATRFGIRVPHFFGAPSYEAEPGGEFMALWGTGYEKGRAYVEVEHRGKILQSYWTDPERTQVVLRQRVDEGMRGGFVVRLMQMRENRLYVQNRIISVPWSNKQLQCSWEHFTSRLEPGRKETWSLVIRGAKAEKAAAELVATLYDESLDAFCTHSWPTPWALFRQEYVGPTYVWGNAPRAFQFLALWSRDVSFCPVSYWSFLPELLPSAGGYGYRRRAGIRRAGKGAAADEKEMERAPALKDDQNGVAMAAAPPASAASMREEGKADGDRADKVGGVGAAPAPGPDLSQVIARKNLNETAFFFPHLVSDAQGVVKLTFTMPEALTQWRFLAFAHDQELRSAFFEARTVTAKDLMVQPHAPRFLREGDTLEFTVKVLNRTATRQKGRVRLTLADARTGESVDRALGNTKTDLEFDIPAQESRSYAWRLTVPDGMGFLTYKAVASSGRISDGEEGYLPVLSRRIFVTESLPLSIRGPGEGRFEFERLRAAAKSDTLRPQNLVVQMVSQPAWYAVLALPYLMEFPHECSEQVFNRFYANSLARWIALSDPKIRTVFEQWKNTTALDSPLEKHEDLKAVALEETPWLRQAQSESQARRQVGVLFDDNRLTHERERTLRKLTEMQYGDGRWPWFAGGPPSDYMTLYIVTGFGRLRHLGVDVSVDPALRALGRLDLWVDEMYRKIPREHRDNVHLTPLIALYLYGRSFFLKDQPVKAEAKEAVDYWLGQARRYWLQVGHRQSQAHLALALKRFGDPATAMDIVRSIREHAVSSEEMGLFWRDTESSWWWYRAPIETQALMIEMFDEVGGDARTVEDCKVWLLKQKQTQDWKTTKATADAVYALLLRGANLLASDALVEVSLGKLAIRPEKVEAGTGFYERRFQPAEIRPAEMATVTVKKTDVGIAWGSVHWQYLEEMSKVTPHKDTPLKLRKSFWVKRLTKQGPVLEPVRGPLQVGDEAVVRIELRTDRDMEYVHLKDQRGSGLEPLNVLSQYRYQDGLGYYECTRDTASHFFIDYLPKGVYVFEYAARVQHRGSYQSGIAQIQCMYAPEFNSHSESVLLTVQ